MGDIGWKYYNHALLPATAPHETVNTAPVDDGSIWKAVWPSKPLFARWTTDWDCGYETGWWFVICTPPFSLSGLSKSSRKSVRKALENCRVARIDPAEYGEALWNVFSAAAKSYSNYLFTDDKEGFISRCRSASPGQEYWAGFDQETGEMIGYKICTVYDRYVEFSVSKYAPAFLKLRVSDALNYIVIDYYLNQENKQYISNGERSVIHDTNVQSYYQEHFKFRRAYCRLHLAYRKWFGLLIGLLYPFRRRISVNSVFGAKLTGVLKMEEIRRNQEKTVNA